MVKKCKECKVEKKLLDFPFHDKTKGTYRAQCTECYNIKRKERYEKDPDLKKRIRESNRLSYHNNSTSRKESVRKYAQDNPDKVKVWNDRNKAKMRALFIEYKSKLKCTKCDESHISCLDFHHVDPSQKEGLITKMIYSRLKLERELKKCIVLCSNCHRKLHWNEREENNLKK